MGGKLIPRHNLAARLVEHHRQRMRIAQDWSATRPQAVGQSPGFKRTCKRISGIAAVAMAKKPGPDRKHRMPVARPHKRGIVGPEVGNGARDAVHMHAPCHQRATGHRRADHLVARGRDAVNPRLERRPDRGRRAVKEWDHHRIQRPVNVNIASVRAIFRLVKHTQGTRDIVMCAFHRGATGQHQNNRTPAKPGNGPGQRRKVDLSRHGRGHLDGFDPLDARRLGDGIMCIGAVNDDGIRWQGLAAQVNAPDVAFCAAGTDRAPVVVQIRATPETHQPRDRFTLKSADLGRVMRANVGIAKVVDQKVLQCGGHSGDEGKVIGIAEMRLVGCAHALLGLNQTAQKFVVQPRVRKRPLRQCVSHHVVSLTKQE